MASNAATALPKMRFKFTAEEDIAKYGDDWFYYDETAIMLLSARKLIELEDELESTLVDVMNGFRESNVRGELAASWLGLHLHNPELAGPFEQYSPSVKWIEWGAAPKEESTDEPQQQGPSVKTDSVVLLPTPPLA